MKLKNILEATLGVEFVFLGAKDWVFRRRRYDALIAIPEKPSVGYTSRTFPSNGNPLS